MSFQRTLALCRAGQLLRVRRLAANVYPGCAPWVQDLHFPCPTTRCHTPSAHLSPRLKTFRPPFQTRPGSSPLTSTRPRRSTSSWASCAALAAPRLPMGQWSTQSSVSSWGDYLCRLPAVPLVACRLPVTLALLLSPAAASSCLKRLRATALPYIGSIPYVVS